MDLLSKAFIIVVITALAIGIQSIIYDGVMNLIEYNADLNDRHARVRDAEKELNDIEAELNNRKDWKP